MKVTTKWMEGHLALTYSYTVDSASGLGFKFHLLSEVGAPWQARAEQMANALAKYQGRVINQVELNAKPWYVDALVKEK
jgi:hypothetical protein